MKKKTIIFFAEKEENVRHLNAPKRFKMSGFGIWCQLAAFDVGEAFSNVGAWMLKQAGESSIGSGIFLKQIE